MSANSERVEITPELLWRLFEEARAELNGTPS